MAEITRIVKRNALLFSIIWLAFTAVLMYQRNLYAVPRFFEHVNMLLLALLVAYVLTRHFSAASVGIGGAFMLYAIWFAWQRVGGAPATSVSLLSLLQILTGGYGYIAIQAYYTPAEITRQIRAAGWLTWGWGLLGLTFQLLTGQRLNAAAAIVFQPQAGALYFVMLLAFGLERAPRRERLLYLGLGSLMVLTTMWRSRICVVMVAALGAAYAWQKLRARLPVGLQIGLIGIFGGVSVFGVYTMARLKMSSVLMRLELWQKTGQLIKAHPLLGVGLGRYYVYTATETFFDISGKLARYGEQRVLLPNGAPIPYYAAHAHNAYLTLAAETGLLGCSAVCLVLCLLWLTRRYRPAGANYALLAFMVSNLTGDTLYLWLIAALVAASAATTRWREFWETEAAHWPKKHAIAALGSFYLVMTALILVRGLR